MVDGAGKNPLAARDAILAAIQRQSELANGIKNAAPGAAGALDVSSPSGSGAASFANDLKEGVAAVQKQLRTAETLPEDLINGKIDDFHEVAVHLKKADLSFRFALQVRNKLIDAYREVMRMNV